MPLLKIVPFLTMPNNINTMEESSELSRAAEADKKCVDRVIARGGNVRFVARLESLLTVNKWAGFITGKMNLILNNLRLCQVCGLGGTCGLPQRGHRQLGEVPGEGQGAGGERKLPGEAGGPSAQWHTARFRLS